MKMEGPEYYGEHIICVRNVPTTSWCNETNVQMITVPLDYDANGLCKQML
jgi:hypothetical protein